MNIEICPVCKGSGRAVVRQRYNGVVDPQKPAIESVCWMCEGAGKIVKSYTNHLLLHKYYLVENENAEET